MVIGNLSFENVEKFRYLGVTVTNTNDIRIEIKRRINIGNACYYSLEKIVSPVCFPGNWKLRHIKQYYTTGCIVWLWNLVSIFREEHRLRVFENKVLRKIFGANKDEITGEWRKLQNAELHTLYSSSNIIRNLKSRRLRWAGHVARVEQSRNAYRDLVGEPERMRPLGRPRRRWEDSFKIDLRELGCYAGDWIDLAWDMDQWWVFRTVMNLQVL